MIKLSAGAKMSGIPAAIRAARVILRRWNDMVLASNGDTWYMSEERQACRDSLERMKREGLIKRYALPSMIEGVSIKMV